MRSNTERLLYSPKTHFSYERQNRFGKTLCHLTIAHVQTPVVEPPRTPKDLTAQHCPTCSRSLQNKWRANAGNHLTPD